jgi:tetratricopeptide (TPR) repeat protein
MKNNYLFLLSLTSTIAVANSNSADCLHHYLWANYNHFAGNISHAHNWYAKLFSTNNSIYTYKGYLNFLADTKQFKQIADLMPQIQKKFSNDADIQLLFANALEKTNRGDSADNHIIILSQTFKTHTEISFRAAQTYMKRREPENALLTIDAFLNNTPRKANNFVFYFLKTQIYMQLSQFTHALDNIQKCLEMHPQFDKGWLLCASLYEKEGKIKEALSGYATFLELSGGNKEIEKHLCNLMLKYKSLEDNNHILLSHTISVDNALILFQQHRYPQALAHINSCIEQQPHNNECKLLKIQILSALKDFKQAAETIATWVTADPKNDVWPKSLCMLAYNGMPRAQIIETFNNILTKTADNLWCNLYCADMCLRNTHHDRATQCLTNALSCTMNDTIRIKTLYQLAMLSYERGDHQTMHTHLEHAHTIAPDNAHINNALAYYWATKGKDNTQAHAFIDKALAADNTNPYFLDTQAVILYKEKKYEESHNILANLAHHNNGTILLHLAKVHYALNNKENADIFTQKAHAVAKNDHEKKAVEKMQLLLART